MRWNNKATLPQLLSLYSRALKPTLLSTHTATTEACALRVCAPQQEKPPCFSLGDPSRANLGSQGIFNSFPDDFLNLGRKGRWYRRDGAHCLPEAQGPPYSPIRRLTPSLHPGGLAGRMSGWGRRPGLRCFPACLLQGKKK